MHTSLRLPGIAARLAPAICLVLLVACNGGVPVDIPLPLPLRAATPTPTPSFTATPVLTPTPQPALPPDHIWVSVEGKANSVLSVPVEGEPTRVWLPLNEGQQASDVIASRDGSTLAYLVWNADDTQRGIAVWNLLEPNARLIAQPLPGYRITGLLLADDAAALAYVLIQEGLMLDEADWRVESVAEMGDEPSLLASRADMDGFYPPTLVAWPAGGALLLNYVTPDGSAQGIYAVDPDGQQTTRLVPPEGEDIADAIVVGATLSPDHERLAYLTYDETVPSAYGDLAATNAARIVDLESGEVITMTPPAGHAIYGLRWYPDAIHVLLDIVKLPPDEEGRVTQLWAMVEAGQPLPWSGTTLGPEREYLFDYEAFRDGVVFTILPADEEWELYLISNLPDDAGLRTISIAEIAQEFGAPAIVRVP
jgi:hypothetical protein